MAERRRAARMCFLPATRDLNNVVVMIFMADVPERTGTEVNLAGRQLDESQTSRAQRYRPVVLVQERRNVVRARLVPRAGEKPRLSDVDAGRNVVRREMCRDSLRWDGLSRPEAIRVRMVVVVVLMD